jgi:hypothetical protein
VSDILDLLARKTGMKIIYDGAPPRLLVSPRVERENASQAVLALLEGLGLAYVLITDRTAREVETLFIASGVGRGTAPSASRPPGSPPLAASEPQEKPQPQPDEDEEEEMMRPAVVPQEPDPSRREPPRPEPPRPQQVPNPVYPVSPFGPQGPQPVVIPGQPFIPGITPPPTPQPTPTRSP